VLVEGDDFNEPICDASRGILDGHLILSRDLAATGHYPAIDILNSVSRLATKVAPREETAAAQRIREALAVYQQSADLIQLGAHIQGANPKLDQSIRLRPQILDFLRQNSEAHTPLEETTGRLLALAKELA
jgi:flagellar biosynthesis/type III secretory pathway ATPase